MRRIKRFAVIFAILAGFAICGATTHAAPEKFLLSKNHTYVGFDVSYLVVARVSGHFDNFQGTFIIDRNRLENNRADILINTGSVDTGSSARDEDIRGPGLFNTTRYPIMTFHSKNIELKNDNTGIITGDLTLLGITKPVTLDFVRTPDPKSQQQGKDNNFTGGFKITGKIRRSDFGMNAYIRPIGNTVTLYVCYDMIKCGGEDTNQEKIKPHYNR